MIEHAAHYIGGQWQPSKGTEKIEVVNAATEEVMGSIPAGNAEDADQAVRAARDAFDSWSTTPPDERAGYLKRAAEGLQLRQTEIAMLVSQEVGMPFAYSNVVQVGLPVQSFVSIADVALDFPFERRVYNSLVVREPIGVVVAITPWNYPLHQIAAKVAPALAAGCTVVLKPSEVAPLNAYVLAEVFDSIGLPPGVFNLVTGTGVGVGETLVAHPEVDMVSLTGSTVAGRRIGAVAAETIKRVSLELGGKSALIVLEDADVTEAVSGGLSACYLNSGQTCIALTRMIVPKSKLAEVEAIAKFGAESIAVGDPFDPATVHGSVGVGRAARPGGRLHREGHRRGRASRRRRAHTAGRAGQGLLRPADGLLRCHAGHGDRARGDLRSGPGDPDLRRRGRGRCDWPTTRSSG